MTLMRDGHDTAYCNKALQKAARARGGVMFFWVTAGGFLAKSCWYIARRDAKGMFGR